MVEYEFMFGDTWCLITVSPPLEAGGNSGFRARPYVLGHRGRSPRAVGDREGQPVAFEAETEAGVLARTSEYLEDRFGPLRAAPAPTTSYVTSYRADELAEEPPLQDLRPDPILVLALERIHRGDEIIVTAQGARVARHRLTGTSSGVFRAIAAEDIEKGQHGRVRQDPDTDQ